MESESLVSEIRRLKTYLAFRDQQIKDACAALIKEPIESAPGVETAANKAYKILWRSPY